MTDSDLIDLLRELDKDDDVTVTQWECNFIESVCFPPERTTLSDKERVVVCQILEKYDYLDE